MTGSAERVPDRIVDGDYQFLNCKIGEKVTPKSKAESLVLESLESSLANSFLQIYYKYPNTGNRDDEYLDIIALHGESGVVVIEVVDIEVDQIDQIKGPDWYLDGRSRPIRPKSVASNGKISIRHQVENRSELTDSDDRSVVPCKNYVALPNIPERDWKNQFNDLSRDGLIFENELRDRETLSGIIKPLPDDPLSEEQIRDTLAVLKFSDSISGGQLNTAATPETKRELLEHVNQRLKILTDKQLKIGLQSPDSPQRIRGIAGSGKTVVTAFRAARLHWENPKWEIAVTFRNRGLRQTYEKLISAFYKQFSDGDDFNEDKLHIFHAWGGATPGMYSTVASKSGVNPMTFSQARRNFVGGDYLGRCCGHLLKSEGIPSIFNAVLIDEGQDLPASFYTMCYRSCDQNKRIYWSYDEAQSLGSLQARSARELFGVDENGDQLVDVSGKLPDGVNPTHIMRTSFRTPRSILMTSHGFGMGMYREGPVIQSITNKEGWRRIGYNIAEGDFKRAGNKVTLKRDLKRSPHPLWDYQTPDELLRQYWADSREEEIEWVANDIKKLIDKEDVLPEEIMITFLWSYSDREDLLTTLKSRLEEEIDGYDNVVNDVSNIVSNRGDRGIIEKEGKISLSNIYHSRGNQAPFVYVMGLDMVAEETSKELTKGKEKVWRKKHVDIRNKAFVGFTRTQGWLRITGTDPTNRIVGELNRVLDDTRSEHPELTMEVPPKDSPFKDLDPKDPYLEPMDE